jgi:peroxiredoxin Q/BCP
MAYQADLARFEQAGWQVIGISTDNPARNKAFAEELGLRFPVLSDAHKTVTRAYGILIPVIGLARRRTFIIDQQGVIRQIHEGGDAADPSHALQTCSTSQR